MAAQMVQMIQTQRGYEASSKIITTADQLIQETLALKT
jgi:flagellar hook protein FlgE